MRSVRKIQVVEALVAAVAFCLTGIVEAAQYGGGSGTADDPYQIWTAEQMNAIGAEPNDWDKHFRLMADIDLSAYDGREGRPVFNIIAPYTPVLRGQSPEPFFTGTFDGGHHTLSGFTWVLPGGEDIGLFGIISGAGAEVRDLGLVDPDVDASAGRWIGALAGRVQSQASIRGCYVSGGRVVGDSYVAGLVGGTSGAIVHECYSTGNVVGSQNIGGLIGYNVGKVASCYAAGAASGGSVVGGLVGYNGGTVVDCYAAATVSGDTRVGGLLGANGNTVTDCYACGRVTGNSDVGGLVGFEVENEWWNSLRRGVVGASFWDIQTSGQLNSAGGTGLTTGEMQKAATFSIWNAWGDSVSWTIEDAKDYPRLPWEDRTGATIGTTRLPGTGTAEQPYLIYTAEALEIISLYPSKWGTHFRLMAHVDLSTLGGKSFGGIGTGDMPFTGVFDGQGHTVSNVFFRGTIPDHPTMGFGFFGAVGHDPLASRCEIKDLSLVNVDVDVQAGDAVGGLAGYVDDRVSIANCRSSGKVSGSWAVGGLVGFVQGGAEITCCCSTASTAAEYNVGGLVGYSEGTIEDCYARGSVTGGDTIGGLVGDNVGRIYTSYSTGRVQGDANTGGLAGGSDRSSPSGISFWDIETSGQTGSNEGTGRTTAQMQAAKTFIGIGWDFVGETANGTQDIWWIDEGRDYPRLWWEVEEKEDGTTASDD